MKLLIVDDSVLVVSRVVEMSGGIERMEELFVVRTLSEALKVCCVTQPDVVVLDAVLPDGNSIEAISVIRSAAPAAKVFIFTNYPEFRYRAEERGVDGFFDKSLEFEGMVAALQDATAGDAGCARGAGGFDGI